MNNAVKFTHVGSIELGVKIEEANLLIYVKDKGRGISEENMNLLFTRFAKIISSQYKVLEGLGIGLSISKRIAIELGADIVATSKEGEGSLFILVIPINKVIITT